MLTKKVKKRILFLTLIIIVTVTIIFNIIKNLNKNLLYFRTPSDISQDENIKINHSIRLGGMVKKNSIIISKKNIQFTVTDFKNEILINYAGTVPNLFAEGKGVVVEGKLNDNFFFTADRILAKHDENYMPPGIKKILENNAK